MNFDNDSTRGGGGRRAAVLGEGVLCWSRQERQSDRYGAVALLDHLRDLSIPMALATSTRRPTTELKLVGAGLDSYFCPMICGEETPRGKPHPDPYLAAADVLHLAPAQCWALEDSENGVRAALSAGCVVFQIPDLVAPSAEMRALGHVIKTSLLDVLALL